MNHNWSEWYPLEGGQDVYQKIPNKKAGIYRVSSPSADELIYIGQTGRCLRERLRALRKGVYSENMPYNDPHTAAPNLWVWRHEKCFVYEFSFLLTEIDTPQRQGLEDFFLWQHRKNKGCSTLCNYGRFHRSWRKPSNKMQGRTGCKLKNGELNSAGLSCSTPLQSFARSTDRNWMSLNWSESVPLEQENIKYLPKHCAIYRLQCTNSNEVIYIGETQNLVARLTAHARVNWGGYSVSFSFVNSLNLSEAHLRHEVEVDLIGAYFEEQERVPIFQYGSGQKSRVAR
ncbi:GIY-YIG nuclease family protein [Gammaproteobacteria bacterium AS21]|jgi:hypothetical protein